MPVKARVCAKIEASLALLREDIRSYIGHHQEIPAELRSSTGKISRGENYHSYSYRVLDYPALFSGEDLFTFRTVALWGMPFGFHLILSGTWLDRWQMPEMLSKLPEGFLIATHASPWVWEPEGCVPPDAETALRLISQYKYLKISYFLAVDQYDLLPETGLRIWKMWQELLFE